mmetsp:Transcript_26739/g.61618  ORF Transcript_26739/g.61618 Transcript_26739/m.61618 type:complete len:93 (+) Transcript_26739:323-601(+)
MPAAGRQLEVQEPPLVESKNLATGAIQLALVQRAQLEQRVVSEPLLGRARERRRALGDEEPQVRVLADFDWDSQWPVQQKIFAVLRCNRLNS